MDLLLNILDNFTYHEKWNFGILQFIVLISILYFFLLPTSPTHTKIKSGFFILGFIIYFFALGSPLNLLGRILFRAHMIQMIMLYFVSAPLVALGIKAEFLCKPISIPFLNNVLRKSLNPVGTLIVFHVLFISYHIPFVFDYVRINLFLNYFYLLLMFIVSFLFWCAIFPPIKELNQLNNQSRKKLFIGFMVLFIPLVALLLLPKHSLYSIYTDIDQIKSSIEICLPSGGLPEEFIEDDIIETMLPFPPQHEQFIGGFILFICQLVSLSFIPVIKRLAKQ